MNNFFLRAYATIPDLLSQVFHFDAFVGVPINTYGFFVAMGFMVAAIVTSRELNRRGNLGQIPKIPGKEWVGKKPEVTDFIFPAFFWFFIGMKIIGALIHNVDLLRARQATVEYFFSTEGFPIYGIIAAFIACGYTYYSINKKALNKPYEKDIEVPPADLIGELVFVAAIFGVIGSSIFELIQPNSNMTLLELFSNPMNFLSGLTIYGGLFFGIIGILLYAWHRKLKPFVLFDTLVPGFILAMSLGRMGCHFSGDGDWGIENTSPAPSWLPDYFWSNNYAHNVLNEGEQIAGCVGPYCSQLVPGVYPTAIYEILMFMILFAFMWSIRKKITHIPGFMFMVFFVVSGIERFPIEMIRVTDRFSAFFNLSQAQIISICMIIIGVLGMIYLGNRYKNEKAFD